MSETIFCYLYRERDRLEQALIAARMAKVPDVREIACLQQQCRIIDDQVHSWANDLGEVLTAA